jgi:hypothetical protein
MASCDTWEQVEFDTGCPTTDIDWSQDDKPIKAN